MSYMMYDPTRVLFGAGQLGHLHEQAMPGKKALLVISNGRSVQESGALDRTIYELSRAGVQTVLFDRVQANPRKSTVMAGAKAAKENGCEFIVALGGGSVMDAAKIMAMMAPNEGDLWDYVNGGTGKGQTPPNTPLPLVCITTTAGTGSEVDQWGVINNEETQEKIGCGGLDSLFPVLAVVDPELMASVPPQYTAYQGFDALFHSTEVYISKPQRAQLLNQRRRGVHGVRGHQQAEIAVCAAAAHLLPNVQDIVPQRGRLLQLAGKDVIKDHRHLAVGVQHQRADQHDELIQVHAAVGIAHPPGGLFLRLRLCLCRTVHSAAMAAAAVHHTGQRRHGFHRRAPLPVLADLHRLGDRPRLSPFLSGLRGVLHRGQGDVLIVPEKEADTLRIQGIGPFGSGIPIEYDMLVAPALQQLDQELFAGPNGQISAPDRVVGIAVQHKGAGIVPIGV